MVLSLSGFNWKFLWKMVQYGAQGIRKFLIGHCITLESGWKDEAASQNTRPILVLLGPSNIVWSQEQTTEYLALLRASSLNAFVHSL
jgi:hypothetical protein